MYKRTSYSVLASLAGLALVILACARLNPTTTGAPGNSAPSSSSGNGNPAPNLSNLNPQDIATAFSTSELSYPYRLTDIYSSSTCSKETTKVVEVASYGEWHLKGTGGCQDFPIEIIMTGGKAYAMDQGYYGDQKWHEEDATQDENLYRAHVSTIDIGEVQNLQHTGDENLKGISTSVYTFDFETPSKKGTDVKVGIGAKDGLVHQVQAVISLPANGIEIHTQFTYEYGISVDIQAPKP